MVGVKGDETNQELMCKYILIKNGDKGKFSEKGFCHCGVALPLRREAIFVFLVNNWLNNCKEQIISSFSNTCNQNNRNEKNERQKKYVSLSEQVPLLFELL